MKEIQLYIRLILAISIGVSCTTTRKSAAYYQENKEAIDELRRYYDTLYQQQPFSAGFTDKSLNYYVMQINTDTLRAIYTNETKNKGLWENIYMFQYDTVMLKKMAVKMKQVKCLWLTRASYYLDEQKESFTFISFGSALIDKPFVENKYYVLVFLDHKIDHPELEARIKKGKLVPIDDLVYFTISNSYR